MAGGRQVGEETRNQMMQNLFGDQFEDDDEEDEDEFGAEVISAPRYPTPKYGENEGESEAEIEGENEIEGQGEVDVESEAEHNVGHSEGESEGERLQSSSERESRDQRMVGEGADADSDEGYGPVVVSSRRREEIDSESDASADNHYNMHERETEGADEEKILSKEPGDEIDHEVVRDVFGDSDEDEPADFLPQHEDEGSHRFPVEEEAEDDKELRPEDIVLDEDAQYESEDGNIEKKAKEKPVGPPLNMEIPLRPPPRPKSMNMIKVSNIMGIEPKPFDPKSYVEEDIFVTDESGTKKRIRLEDNIVRWRNVRNRDGSPSYESNARFVKWSDGSFQLLIGNEVLDISVHNAYHDQTHLFLRHGQGILQSQGRLLQKMRFMPSSLSSKSHRLLTALVDSRNKKVYKVKNCVTHIDPEREKEEKEKAEGQNIRANELLHRKREKVNRKYSLPMERGRQLSPGFLNDPNEEEEDDDHTSRKASARRRTEEDFEAEEWGEKRILNAKRKGIPHASRSARSSADEYSESEKEESEYDTEGEDIEMSPSQKEDPKYEDAYEDDAEEEPHGANTGSEDDYEDVRGRNKETIDSVTPKGIDSEDDSPPRKTVHRRKAIVFDSDEE